MSLLRPFAASLLGLSAGFAQNEANPPPLITPNVPGAPAQAPPGPGAPRVVVENPIPGANGAIPLGEQKITQPIIQPKLTGTDLAGLYRNYTGRRVIVTNAASLAEFSFVQDASPADPLTNAQAAELLKKAAALENFIFVPDNTDPNLDILTFAAGGINPKGVGVGIFTESDTLPEGGTVISYVMNLKYLKPDEAVRTFTAVIGQFGTYGSITPVTNASSVVITENASLIRRLIELKEQIDKPSSQVGTRFIKVEYADVTELATTLNELLNAQQTAQRTAGVQRTGNTPPPVPGGAVVIEGAAGGGGGGGGEETPPQIVADPRTNRIFAMGRPVDLLFIEGLVSQFDMQSDSRNSLRRRLSYLSAVDFLPIAEQALLRAFTSGGAGSGAAPAGGAGGAGAAGGNRGGAGATGGGAQAGRNAGGTSSSQFGSGGGSSSRGGGGQGTITSGLADPDNNVAPQPLLVGRTLLVADTITNSIVVQGPPASLEIVSRLLDEIDVKAEQVMISCVFGQLALGKDLTVGVDYLRLLNNDIAGRGGSGAFTPLPVDGTTSFIPGPLTGALNGLGVYGKIGDWRVMLNALDQSSRFEVLSRPTVFMANNQKGTISSGTQIAVPTSSYAATAGNQSSTNFEFRDVALTLEVIPLVNSPTEITLKIFLVSQDLGQERQVTTELAIPDILSRELLTTVTVPNNETIVLGGLITNRTTKSKSGIPILSQIPYIGGLFGKTITGTDRDELMIFIQPSIVSDRTTLDAAQVDMDSRYDLTPSIRKFADGPGVLPPPDLVPLNEKGTSTTTTKKKAIIVDPAIAPAKAYPHGTRFRSTPR